MPGANCSIFGCPTSRKCKGIAIFKVPTGDDEYNTRWREKIVHIITKDRVIYASLKRQIEKKLLYTCELHYHKDCLIRNETKTTRVPNSLPTLNLPVKSFSKDSIKERGQASIVKRELAIQNVVTHSTIYKSFADFLQRIQKYKLEGWEIKHTDNKISIVKQDTEHALSKFEIITDQNLNYKILCYNWPIPISHELHTKYESSFQNITISNLIHEIEEMKICPGLPYKSEHILSHHIPKIYCEESSYPISYFEINRPKDCVLLCTNEKCPVCYQKNQQHLQYLKRREGKLKEPAQSNAPITLTSRERLKISLQDYRIENKELKDQIKMLQKVIDKSAIQTSESLNNDLVSIMSSADPNKVSPFMKFFWEQQQKYIQSSSTGVRYHPAVTRYCLSLLAKSSSMYEDIRYNEKTGTGFLILPSQRRLRDYKNYICPQRGFNKDIIMELSQKTKEFSDSEKYVSLLFDEMKIQESLVWDKHTGELVGYVDLGDAEVNQANFDKPDTIATHVLVIMVRSIINPFKFSLANFATTSANSSQLFTLFWKAVSILELSCQLKVIAVTCDGASSNRKMFKMHSKMNVPDVNIDVVYKTKNLYCTERYIFFIADQPHLLKTARNCLADSGSGTMSRYMWNNGFFLLWSHVAQMFHDDLNCGLQLLPKITYDHVKLTSFSKMNVKLAAQVLSSTVSKVMSEFGSPDSAETAKFCLMLDTFFDIVNIRNKTECVTKAKPNLKPISSPEDPRLSWLLNDFLGYFKDWKESIEKRPGQFDNTARGKMFISRQTHEGLKITVHSIVECVKFLLVNGIDYVLTERFCQDPLENYFGRQRSLGARKDNPTLRDVGYNDNSIRNQKVFRPIAAGNCIDQASIEISNEKIPCRKKFKADNNTKS